MAGSSGPTNAAALPQHLLRPFPSEEGNLRALSGESSKLDRLINIPLHTLSFLSFERRLTLRKHLITLDLCHFAAYLNELKAGAGSSRAWGISWVQQVVDAGKGQPALRYQWLHRSGQLETAPVPAQEVEEGAEQGWELKVPQFGELSAAACGSWITFSDALK